MPSIAEAIAVAVQHHQAGRLDAAEQIYRQVLAAQPHHADALNLLGVIGSQRGQYEAAVELLTRAIKENSTEAGYYINLGNALFALRRAGEAAAAYERAVTLAPDLAEAHCSLGNALQSHEKLDEAAAAYRRALALKPGLAQAHSNLGAVLKALGNLDEAVVSYRRAVELMPNLAEAHLNLGNALRDKGQLDDAIACYRQALKLKPDLAQAHSNLGHALRDKEEWGAAMECFERTVELQPGSAEAHSNLGAVQKARGMLAAAMASYRRAVDLDSRLAEVFGNLGNALISQGKIDEALASYQRAIDVKPAFIEPYDSLLLSLHYLTDSTLASLADAHAEFNRRHSESLRSAWRPFELDRDPNRRLRLGFVSADFGMHPVGYFVIRCLENIDGSQCETVCYSDRPEMDCLTARFKDSATQWQLVNALNDQQLNDRIVKDRIDILFDLAGHSAKNRLLVFARKPAPIQVTWAGYMGTTGLTSIDYILADRYEIPEEAERYYAERVLRLPDGYVCYDPPDYAPAVSPLPALDRGFVTFGCFNNPAKIKDQMLGVWAKILQRVPASRLVLKYTGMDDPLVSKRITDFFASHRVDPTHVECLGASPHAELLAEYGRVDLALDTFPYNGGLTTCEALWMGVPVITCPGETFASRHSLSHLSNVGATETIARNLDDYVELAVAWSNDLARLANQRRTLRERMAASPLCDGQRFAKNFTRVLREAWQQWCRNAGS